MEFTITCTGTSPLLMHNPQMVDPDFEINRQLKVITAKRKRTEEDNKQIEKLEWYGGLYTHNFNGKTGVRVSQPTSKLRKCLINAAKVSRLGKSIERAVSFLELHVPLIYDGPQDIDKLFDDSKYHSRLSVGINKKRVIRVRPSFFPWGLECRGVYFSDAGLPLEDFRRIVEMAGVIEGIGDNRVNGYGRFEAVLKITKK